MAWFRLCGIALAGLLFLFTTACAPINISNRDINLKPLAADKNIDLDRLGVEDYVQTRFLLSPGDTVEIKYPFRAELNDSYKVRTDGRISLPFIGDFVVANKTPAHVQLEIGQAYMSWMLSETDLYENTEYKIQVSDQIEIKFPYNDDFDQLVVVRPDGRISLPLVGSIIVAGKTPEELNEELLRAYKNYLNAPNLVVIVREFSRNTYYVDGQPKRPRLTGLDEVSVVVRDTHPLQVFIGGEVQAPGFFPLNTPVTVIQAIIMAGGHKDTAEMRQVIIIRKDDEKPKLLLRNLQAELAFKDDNNMPVTLAALGDVMLQENDVVIVPKSNIAKLDLYLNQYLYNLVPALKNSSFGFVYHLNPVDTFTNKTSLSQQ